MLYPYLYALLTCSSIIRYLGAMVSAVDLIDSGFIKIATTTQRDKLLEQAKVLAKKLNPAFNSPTNMMWPRVNFTSGEGCREPPNERADDRFPHANVEPARAG